MRAWAQVLIALVLKVLADKLVCLMRRLVLSGLSSLLPALKTSLMALRDFRCRSRGTRQDNLCKCCGLLLVSDVIEE